MESKQTQQHKERIGSKRIDVIGRVKISGDYQ